MIWGVGVVFLLVLGIMIMFVCVEVYFWVWGISFVMLFIIIDVVN